jgi:hypothetical protein
MLLASFSPNLFAATAGLLHIQVGLRIHFFRLHRERSGLVGGGGAKKGEGGGDEEEEE